MAKLRLRALKAKKGDSLFLFADAENKNTERDSVILIDGGPAGVFKSVLKDQLRELGAKQNEPPLIDLMMVSHIDDDHINGILQLTDELLEARESNREELCHIRQAWHNSFSDFILRQTDDQPFTTPSDMNTFSGRVASLFKDHIADAVSKSKHECGSELVLASVKQGRQLRINLKQLDIRSNSRFKDKIIVIPKGVRSRTRTINRTVRLRIIGPHQEELDALRKTWKKELPNILSDDDAGVAAAVGKLDKSVANLASITVIAETRERDKASRKRMLLTGDARGDKILEWLKRAHELNTGRAHFDVLKLPHHGSDKNVSLDFFKQVTADHYVISGDGSHGNPEPAVFEMLFGACQSIGHTDYKIHMTYDFDELEKKSAFKKEDRPQKLSDVIKAFDTRDKFVFPKGEDKFIEIAL